MHQLKDQYQLRLPEGWREAIKIAAIRNRRSMNQEILAALESVVIGETGAASANSSPASTSNNAALAGGASINR